MLLFDFGAQVDGYRSDMTRTLFVGEPTERDLAVYGLVAAAQAACSRQLEADASRGGLRAADRAATLDALAREVIEADGRWPAYGHGLGHGIGLATHELPGLGRRSPDDAAAAPDGVLGRARDLPRGRDRRPDRGPRRDRRRGRPGRADDALPARGRRRRLTEAAVGYDSGRPHDLDRRVRARRSQPARRPTTRSPAHMISTGELRKGVAIELDGELWQILDYHHIKMGRGSAQVRITLRNIKRGQTVERSFQAGTKWPRASMEKRPVQFLYRDGDDFHFMDTDTYDQFMLRGEQLGDAAQYMKDGMTLDRTSYQGETIGVELPVTVDLGSRRPSRASPATRAGRAQAGDDRDRPGRAGPAVRRTRATRSASTPAPGSTRPGSEPGRGEHVCAAAPCPQRGSRRRMARHATRSSADQTTTGPSQCPIGASDASGPR